MGASISSFPNNIMVLGTQNYSIDNRKLKTAAKNRFHDQGRQERRQSNKRSWQRGWKRTEDRSPRAEDGRLTPLRATSRAHGAIRLSTSHPEQIKPPHSKPRATHGGVQGSSTPSPPPFRPQTRPDPDRRPTEGWGREEALLHRHRPHWPWERTLPQAGPGPRSPALFLALPLQALAAWPPPPLLRLPQAPPRPRSQIEAPALARPSRPRTQL